ncbi:hypothetical protein A3K82_01515 [Candidatus Pacearchaeota archaeon RBG_19FT_COMBO_34_9]|nr:MAG: hypothetical protein A3K82_01515 [Candidatus Pacearchaeota archaeon RBG_19FT_COMBO_34_9]OGJ16868.1 MAG: hypothetical protein A3K74_01000 [Candidatus Pacearchaeota archaeon RBG_13_33_26]
MKILKQKCIPYADSYTASVALVADNMMRSFNVAINPLYSADKIARREINLKEAHYLFPTMVNEKKAREEYRRKEKHDN